ncbi:MAG: uronate dehydrogenase [Actinomycetota bacterium]|jgi:uronate dehydrogenase|nr:uronate dehydrogenase [Actinomycetota bacterium]
MEAARFRRVLLTGAAGRIGSVLREGIRGELEELRLSDRELVEPVHGTSETFAGADLLDPAEVARIVQGVDVIVHLGGHPDEAGFAELVGPNVHGTFNIFESARRAGVTRIVYASSNHVTGFYTPGERLMGEEPARPDSLYGVTKVFGEALGHLYADKFGLQVIAVRIGSFEDRPREHRHLSTWLSHGDAVRLFRACLAPQELSFLTIYGVSANTRSWWPRAEAAKLIGYEPKDDAEDYAGDLPGSSEVWQGGRFALPDYGGWNG